MGKKNSKQVAALPVRKRGGQLQVLLVTTRGKGRWIIPKGWPCKRLPDHASAAKEAHEEAGVSGRVRRSPIGKYKYMKGKRKKVDVTVFILKVKRQRKEWKERHQRQRRWITCKAASQKVDSPSLRTILRDL
jgi:8-oxo-dGTP pyrophosphatase MutT (NUDIX family)